jgi:hypothetical protein
MLRENMIEQEITNPQISSGNLPEKRIAEITFDGYKNKLKGRLYGLLCEREKDGEWEKFLESIVLELQGLGANSINWWPLMGKLNLLPYLSYEYFRKTIFECMNLIGGLDMPNELS